MRCCCSRLRCGSADTCRSAKGVSSTPGIGGGAIEYTGAFTWVVTRVTLLDLVSVTDCSAESYHETVTDLSSDDDGCDGLWLLL